MLFRFRTNALSIALTHCFPYWSNYARSALSVVELSSSGGSMRLATAKLRPVNNPFKRSSFAKSGIAKPTCNAIQPFSPAHVEERYKWHEKDDGSGERTSGRFNTSGVVENAREYAGAPAERRGKPEQQT